MAVQFRSASEDARGNQNTVIPTPPAGTTDGDLLLAVQASDQDGSLSAMDAPAGWSEIGSSSRTNVGFVKVWQKIATASEPDNYHFVDSTDANCDVIVVALHGYDQNQPIAVSPVFASGSATEFHPAPSVPGVDGGLLLTAHVAGTNGITRSYSPPNGMTEAQESTLSSDGWILLEVNYKELTSSSATGKKTATCSASRPYVTMSLVVNPFGTQALEPSGIASGEVFGSPAVTIVPPPVRPFSINSALEFGLPLTTVGGADQTVMPLGIASAEAFPSGPYPDSDLFPGSGTFPGSGSGMVLSLSSPGLGPFPGDLLFPGADVFPGVPHEAPRAQLVTPAGIASAEALGVTVLVELDNGPHTLLVTPIDPTETFGMPDVAALPPGINVAPTGIDSTLLVGRLFVMREVPPPTMSIWKETYFVDGVDLTSFAQRIETAEGLQATPGVVGDDVPLPLRDGALQVLGALGQPRRADALGKIVFNLWLKGIDPSTGTLIPNTYEASAEQWFASWDTLVRLFHRRTVTIDHPRPDGTTRRAIAHLIPDESIVPSRIPSSPWFGRFKATFVLPAAHWTDLTEVTTGVQSLVTGESLSLAAFSAATAPCTELTVVFGAGNNPRLSTSYSHIGWNEVIAAGRELGIDTASGQTNQASGAAWTPGYDFLTYSPGPRLFEIDPSEPLEAVLTHTTGGTMDVEVSGKRRYRTS